MSSPTRSENSDIEQLIDAEDNNDAIFATALTGTSPTTTSTLLTTGNGTGATPPTAASRSRSPSIEILTSEDDDEEEEEEESDVEVLAVMETSQDFSSSSGSDSSVTFKSYKRRWYILSLFATMALLQCLVWNTFGPIDKAVKYAYEWEDSTVAMMANWGTILFVIGVAPLSWFLEVKGLRKTVLLVSFLIALGTVLRSLSEDTLTFTIMSHICAILNGLSGITVMAAPPAISAAWFPPHERTTATSINLVFNSLGNAVAFTLGPYLVPDNNSTLSSGRFLSTNFRSLETYTRDEIKRYIEWYMVGQAAVAVSLFCAFVIYFPDKPPTPPSTTSTLPRTDFKKGVRELCGNFNIWLCAIGYALPNGIVSAWQAVMVINFTPLGVSEKEVGFIGFVSTVTYCAIAPFVAFLMDRVKKHFKSALTFLCVASTVCFVWLCLLCVEAIPFGKAQLYLSTILGTSFVGIAGILFFEYTAELAYPAPEGVVGGFITCFNNLLGVFFYSVFFIPNITFTWINYVLVAACVLSIPATALTKADYRRLDLDEPENSSPVSFLRIDESSSVPYAILDNNSNVEQTSPTLSRRSRHKSDTSHASTDDVRPIA